MVFFLRVTFRKAVVLALALTLAACANLTTTMPSAPSPMNKTLLDAELSAMVNLTKPEVISVSALAVKNGQVIYQNQFGRRYLGLVPGQSDLPVNENTLFRIASISKMVTALGVMRLVEQGKLNLDEDVSNVLGWSFRNPNFPDKPISLRLLMTHQSTLTDGNEAYFFDVGVDLRDVLNPAGSRYKAGEYWKRNKAPGTWFEYCNFAWGVIATVMEKATNERFDKLISRLVLQPMQMKGGFNAADFPAADLANVATQYRKRRNEGGKEIWDPSGPWIVQSDDFRTTPVAQPKDIDKYVVGSNGTLFGPQGRLRTTVADLGKLMQMLMNEGKFNDQTILQAATVKALMAQQWQFQEGASGANGDSEGGGSLSWALGGQRFTNTGKDRLAPEAVKYNMSGFGHLGDAYGLMATFVMNPEAKTGFITVVCGPSVNPSTYPAQFSALYRWQETANTALIQHALLGQKQ
jgi:CubicO group peptidase (beta-lactamase class C family)